MQRWNYHPSLSAKLSWKERLLQFPRDYDLFFACIKQLWRLFLYCFMRLYFRLEVVGKENLPAGNFVAVSNHTSHLDSALILCSLSYRRMNQLHAVAAADYFLRSSWRLFFAAILMDGILFERQKRASHSLIQCEKILEGTKESLIFFPEGTRSKDGSLQPFKNGVGYLLAGKECVALPIYIEGAHRAWPKGCWLPRPRKIRLVIGASISFKRLSRSRENYQLISECLFATIKHLKQRELVC